MIGTQEALGRRTVLEDVVRGSLLDTRVGGERTVILGAISDTIITDPPNENPILYLDDVYVKGLVESLPDVDRLLGRLGAGNMGAVYEVELLGGKRKALKFALDGRYNSRFEREIEAMNLFEEREGVPTVCFSGKYSGVYSGVHSNDRSYFVMDLVDGQDLESCGKDLPYQQLYGIMGEVAEILSYSHSQGRLHRDIKPENVMVSGDKVSVIDWGISKTIDETLNEVGSSGTPKFMAPEQFDCNEGKPADVYGLAATFYYLISGRAPFEGNSIGEIYANQRKGKYTPLAEAAEDVDLEIAQLIDEGLRYNPMERPSMGEFQQRVENALSNMKYMVEVKDYMPAHLTEGCSVN